MKILAIEFSTSRRAVAAVEGDEQNGFRVCAEAVEAATRHTPAFRLADEVLAQSGWKKADVDCMTVGIGPGSYTGIRMALAIAQGWQLMTGGKVAGIDMARCLVEAAWREGKRGTLLTAVDALRGECYSAEYFLSDAGWQSVKPLRLMPNEELSAAQASGVFVIGPDLQKLLPQVTPAYPEAGLVGELAVRGGKFVSANELEPIYLRPVSYVKSAPTRASVRE